MRDLRQRNEMLRQHNEMNNTRNLKRLQMNSTSTIAPHHHEPDSPQSSMTSSQFTSVSQHHGPGVMPSSKFKK